MLRLQRRVIGAARLIHLELDSSLRHLDQVSPEQQAQVMCIWPFRPNRLPGIFTHCPC